MPISQNGYSANDRSVITKYIVSDSGRVMNLRKGAPGELLAHFVRWFDQNIRNIDSGIMDDWSYAERPIRGSTTTLSNHASGTAADVDATKWPLGVEPSRYLTGAEIARVRERLGYYEGCIRWGGDYTGRKDPMHFEINRNQATCDRVWARIQAEGSPAPADPPPSGYRPINLGDVTELNTSGEQVRRDQADLHDTGFTLTVDGFAGPDTVRRIVDFQYAAGLERDGAMGPRTRDAIHKVPSWNNASLVGGGHSAREWQQKLKDRGWPIVVDGIWGPRSTDLLRQFQAEKRIDVNGARNYQTWSALHTQPT